MKNKVYIGWDSREVKAYDLAKWSIEKRTSDVECLPLKIDELKTIVDRPIEWRGKQMWCKLSDAPQSTEFAATRFAIPFLTTGWALFLDCDILCLEDINKLFELADEKYAVMVVKHKQEVKPDEIKMVDQASVYYNRKNWSSVMLINCDHEANKRLTIEDLNSWPGRDLHAFKWLKDEEIGELDLEWNYLVDVSNPEKAKEAKILHYTLGGPWLEGWQGRASDRRWHEEWRAMTEPYGDNVVWIPVEKINFRRPYMRTQAGQDAMKGGEYYQRIKSDMEIKGMINPIICVKEGEEYILCLGNKRFIIGRDLGMTQFPTIVVDRDDKDLLKSISSRYKPTGANNAWWEYVKSKNR